jgi:hypothetical protein
MKKTKQKKKDALRISVRTLTAKEEEEFYRTHLNFKTQSLSVEDIERLVKTIPVTDPDTKGLAKGV